MYNRLVSRKKRFALNSIFGTLFFVANTIAIFVVRIFFVRHLGFENLGVVAALTTIVALLCVAEAGASFALQFSLYKPLAENNKNKIALLIKLYKKIYLIIAMTIIVFGLLMLPLLPIFTGFKFMTVFPVFMVLLVTTATTYLLSYNHILLNADQKGYVSSAAASVFKIITSVLQIIALVVFENLLIFVAVHFVTNFLLNLYIWVYVRKKYSYIKQAEGKIEKEDFKVLRKKIYSMLCHKIAETLIAAMDVLLISLFIGTLILGYYSNYLLISASLFVLIGGLSSGLVPYFGDVNATSDRSKVTRIFKNARFANFILYTIAVTGIFVVGDIFLKLWLSEETILSFWILVIFCFNFFVTGYSFPIGGLRIAAGVFEPDRYWQFLVLILKLALCVPFVILFGLVGLLIGSGVALVVSNFIILPVVCKKHIYDISTLKYAGRYFFDLAIALVCITLSYFAVYFIPLPDTIWALAIYGMVCIAVTSTVLCLVYFRTTEFKSLLSIAKGFLKKRR